MADDFYVNEIKKLHPPSEAPKLSVNHVKLQNGWKIRFVKIKDIKTWNKLVKRDEFKKSLNKRLSYMQINS